MKKVKDFVSKNATAVRVAGATAVMMAVPTVSAFAAESSGSSIAINFDTAEMFTFANVIIEALMPVVYITAGLGLGFMIINSLKSAFGSR
jgi:hypothetical protein